MKVAGYLIFVGVIAGLILGLKLPSAILAGYLLIAAIGLVMVVRDMARQAAFMKLFQESSARIIAKAATQPYEAEKARSSPWFADSVVDLDAARQREANDGYLAVGFSWLYVPNPYFVLRAEDLVKWGFATASRVEEAYAAAGSGTAPVGWRDPLVMRELAYMGWNGTEALARSGLHQQDQIRHRAEAEPDRSRRVERATNMMLSALPPDSPTRIEQLARLVDAILQLTDTQLAEVGERFDAALDGAWYDAHSSLSKDAIHVGFCARWARWPNPTDPHENLAFRSHLPPAAGAVETAAAALVEPRLTEAQRSLLYSPLETQIPRSGLGTALKKA